LRTLADTTKALRPQSGGTMPVSSRWYMEAVSHSRAALSRGRTEKARAQATTSAAVPSSPTAGPRRENRRPMPTNAAANSQPFRTTQKTATASAAAHTRRNLEPAVKADAANSGSPTARKADMALLSPKVPLTMKSLTPGSKYCTSARTATAVSETPRASNMSPVVLRSCMAVANTKKPAARYSKSWTTSLNMAAVPTGTSGSVLNGPVRHQSTSSTAGRGGILNSLGLPPRRAATASSTSNAAATRSARVRYGPAGSPLCFTSPRFTE